MNNIKNIIEHGEEFYGQLDKDNNGRFKSWEYCYENFYKAHQLEKADEKVKDYLCLQLAFYLASWGMYRASSFLLKKDYKVHKTIIDILLDDKYESLWGIKINEYKDEDKLNKLFDLVTKIKTEYDDIRSSVSTSKSKISDTLVTKVLLGTLGCVPAYDRFFVDGIFSEGFSIKKFDKDSIVELVEYYDNNKNEFKKLSRKTKNDGIEYPQMKLLDSCFWQLGYNNFMKNKNHSK